MFLSKKLGFFLLLLLQSLSVLARDVLLEFKGAYFHSSSSTFKKIYGHGAALFGPELTFQLTNNEHWYGFLSIDFLNKKGHSIGFCSPTKVSLIPFGLGVKYFEPYSWGDIYAGLGIEPLHLRTTDCSRFVRKNHSQWGCGGIIKIGSYIDLPCNLFADLFIDYSFVKVGRNEICNRARKPVIPLRANLNGALFGVGVGYRFN